MASDSFLRFSRWKKLAKASMASTACCRTTLICSQVMQGGGHRSGTTSTEFGKMGDIAAATARRILNIALRRSRLFTSLPTPKRTKPFCSLRREIYASQFYANRLPSSGQRIQVRREHPGRRPSRLRQCRWYLCQAPDIQFQQ